MSTHPKQYKKLADSPENVPQMAEYEKAYYVNGKLHLLHASSTLGKVVVSEKPFNHMLNNNKSWTGIRVVRMSH